MDDPQDSSAYRVDKLHKYPICVYLQLLKAAENSCETQRQQAKKGDSN
jgi:hypothetical protein